MGAAPLLVRVYGSRRSFRGAFSTLEGVGPQGPDDTVGNVIAGRLPLRPQITNLRHRLAHVLTEWSIDRLTRNDQGRQLLPAWLYDGIAEAEAQRVARHPCHLHGRLPIRLSRISTRHGWRKYRGTPLAQLEYCEAWEVVVHRLTGGGWFKVIHLLHESHPWSRVVRFVDEPPKVS